MTRTREKRGVVAAAPAATPEEPRTPVTPATRRFRLSRVRLLQLASLVVLLGVWQLLSMRTTPLTLPSPAPVFVAVVRLVFSWEFWGSLLVSVQSLAIGYAISVVVGLIVGIVVGLMPRGPGAIFDVYLYIGLAVPIAGLIPVIVMGLGVGLAARVLVVVLFAVYQVAINVSTGVREADRSLVEMAHSFGAPGPTVFRHGRHALGSWPSHRGDGHLRTDPAFGGGGQDGGQILLLVPDRQLDCVPSLDRGFWGPDDGSSAAAGASADPLVQAMTRAGVHGY
jgi:hypothetical protein